MYFQHSIPWCLDVVHSYEVSFIVFASSLSSFLSFPLVYFAKMYKYMQISQPLEDQHCDEFWLKDKLMEMGVLLLGWGCTWARKVCVWLDWGRGGGKEFNWDNVMRLGLVVERCLGSCCHLLFLCHFVSTVEIQNLMGGSKSSLLISYSHHDVYELSTLARSIDVYPLIFKVDLERWVVLRKVSQMVQIKGNAAHNMVMDGDNSTALVE